MVVDLKTHPAYVSGKPSDRESRVHNLGVAVLQRPLRGVCEPAGQGRSEAADGSTKPVTVVGYWFPLDESVQPVNRLESPRWFRPETATMSSAANPELAIARYGQLDLNDPAAGAEGSPVLDQSGTVIGTLLCDRLCYVVPLDEIQGIRTLFSER